MKTVSKVLLAAPFAVGAGLIAGGTIGFRRAVREKVRRFLAEAGDGQREIVTEEHLAGLPEPVQRYLRQAGIVGRPPVQRVWLKQRGRLRQGFEQPWMEVEAEQWFTVSPPSFVWHATAEMAGLPLMQVRDSYGQGRGQMLVTAAGLYPFVNAHGPELDQGTMLRYLGEIIWFPSAALSDAIRWEAVDEQRVKVTLTDRGRSVSGLMVFDEEGRPARFEAERYRDTAEGAVLTPWAGVCTAHGERAGIQIPVKGEVIWHLEEGDLTYYEWEVTAVAFDEAVAEV